MSTGRKFKVIIIANTAWNLINFRAELIRYFLSIGADVVAAAPPDDYVDDLEALGCRFVDLPIEGNSKNLAKDFILILKIYNFLKKENPRFILTFTPKPNLYVSLLATFLKAKIIVNIAGLGMLFSGESYVRRLVESLFRYSLINVHHVFFQNLQDMQLLKDRGIFTGTHFSVLPGSGIDTRKIRAAPLLRRKDTQFLLVARLLAPKGVEEFVQATRIVLSIRSDVQSRIYGFVAQDSPNAIAREQLDKWDQEGVVRYLGAGRSALAHMEASDCVVLPSYYNEGTPRVLLEAGALARPVITTDWPGCRDTVIDGKTGFLCTVRDADSLAECMLRFVSLDQNKRRSMSAAAREYISSNFDVGTVVAEYRRVIGE